MPINQLMSSQLLSDAVSERRGETKKVTRKRDISQGKIQWHCFVWHLYHIYLLFNFFFFHLCLDTAE